MHLHGSGVAAGLVAGWGSERRRAASGDRIDNRHKLGFQLWRLTRNAPVDGFEWLATASLTSPNLHLAPSLPSSASLRLALSTSPFRGLGHPNGVGSTDPHPDPTPVAATAPVKASATQSLFCGNFAGFLAITIAAGVEDSPCSHYGNVCAGGGSVPAEDGWRYESRFQVPPYPLAFTPHNATIFYYFNVISAGQFVPQLTLGNGSPCPGYICASLPHHALELQCMGSAMALAPQVTTAVDATRLLPTLSNGSYMQSQYYFNKPPAVGAQAAPTKRHGMDGGCFVVAGDLIPVNPGDDITTSFHIEDGTWHASISCATRASIIQVPHPYMDPSLSWSDHKTVVLGTCMEVDDLINREYSPPSCPPITVTVSAPSGTQNGWAHSWHLTEDPTCPFGPKSSTATEHHNASTQ
eukprot:gene9853-1776_t